MYEVRTPPPLIATQIQLRAVRTFPLFGARSALQYTHVHELLNFDGAPKATVTVLYWLQRHATQEEQLRSAMPPKKVEKGLDDPAYTHSHALRDEYAAFVNGFMLRHKPEYKEQARVEGNTAARNAILIDTSKACKGAAEVSKEEKGLCVAAARKLRGIGNFVAQRTPFAAAAAALTPAADAAAAAPKPAPKPAADAVAAAPKPAPKPAQEPAPAAAAAAEPQSLFEVLDVPGAALAGTHGTHGCLAVVRRSHARSCTLEPRPLVHGGLCIVPPSAAPFESNIAPSRASTRMYKNVPLPPPPVNPGLCECAWLYAPSLLGGAR